MKTQQTDTTARQPVKIPIFLHSLTEDELLSIERDLREQYSAIMERHETEPGSWILTGDGQETAKKRGDFQQLRDLARARLDILDELEIRNR